MLAIVNIMAPQSRNYRLYGFQLAACAVISLLLTKERVLVLAVGTGVVAVRLGAALVMTRDLQAYGMGFLVAFGLMVVLLPSLRKWKPSDKEPNETRWLGLLCVVAGIIAAAAVVILLKPQS